MRLNKTIATIADLKNVRPIANNIVNIDRIAPYIEEAERLTISDAVTPRIYIWLTNIVDRTIDNQYVTSDGVSIVVTPDQLATLLDGGVYDGDGCSCEDGDYMNGGLLNAIGYLTYERLILNNQVNVTAFGVTVKSSPHSEPADEKLIYRAASGAKNTGLAYLEQAKSYLKVLGFYERKPHNENNVKFKKINRYGGSFSRRH